VFTSNVFALLGLRALYFLLAAAVGRLRYLRPALSIILAAAAAKLLLSDIYTIPVWVSPAFIVSVLAVVTVMSLRDARTRPAARPHALSAAEPPAPSAAEPPARSVAEPRIRPAAVPHAPHPATPGTRPAPAHNGEDEAGEGSGPGRERDEAGHDVNTVYSKQ